MLQLSRYWNTHVTLKFGLTKDADNISTSQVEWDGKGQRKRVVCVTVGKLLA